MIWWSVLPQHWTYCICLLCIFSIVHVLPQDQIPNSLFTKAASSNGHKRGSIGALQSMREPVWTLDMCGLVCYQVRLEQLSADSL